MKDPLNSSIGAQTEDALGLLVDRIDMARVGPGEKPLHYEGTPGAQPLRSADDRNRFGVEKQVQLVICRHCILPFPSFLCPKTERTGRDAAMGKISDASRIRFQMIFGALRSGNRVYFCLG